jgi:hydroxyacylglutathione hydrolase
MTIGAVSIDVLHTPGHTPEHLTFLITDNAAADRPIAAVTGDFLFVGDVGRPDLLEKAAKIAGTMESSAKTLWRSLQQFQQGPDWLQIWPGHGAGSSCGKGISAVPHSTLGYERLFNWALNAKSEGEFVAKVLSGQPDPPPYFAVMKRVNRDQGSGSGEQGSAVGNQESTVKNSVGSSSVESSVEAVVNGGSLVIDTRPADVYASGHVPGTLNIPLGGSFITWAGWLVPYDQDFYLVTDRRDEVRRALALIGLDRIAGYFAEATATGAERIDQVGPADLDGSVVIDVRHDSEWNHGHIPSAIHIPLGQLAERIGEVPDDKPVVVHCQGGGRSSIAASLLKKLGRKHVANLAGGYKAWAGHRLNTD